MKFRFANSAFANTLFCEIPQYFLVRRIFRGIGCVNSTFANTLLHNSDSTKNYVGPRHIVEFHKIVFAKAEFTNPIPQKISRTKKYCGIPQHEFNNIFKFCGTTPQIIPPTFFFDRSSILWKIDSSFASPFPLRIPQIKCGLFL